MRRLRRLIAKRSLRWSEGICVAEGPDLVEAALAAGCEFEGVFVEQGHESDRTVRRVLDGARARHVRVDALAPGVLARVADTVTPQPICATVRFRPRTLDDLSHRGTVAILHDVRDPGNSGTVLRTAEAAGAAAVVVTGHAVDPYNPKAMRASAGACFRIPVVVLDEVADAVTWARGRGRALATVARGGVDYRAIDLSGDVALLFGNEADGLPDSVAASCDVRVTIAMSGATESLNVAACAAVLLFATRDRRSPTGTPPSIEAQ